VKIPESALIIKQYEKGGIDAGKILNARNAGIGQCLWLAGGNQWSRDMQNRMIQNIFLFVFVLVAIVTILGITEIVSIPDFYLKGLFGALVLQLITIVLAAGKLAFAQPEHDVVEHYKWEISYTPSLRQNFESTYVRDPDFAAFYSKNRAMGQKEIEDKELRDNIIPRIKLRSFLDNLFVIKKTGEFAGRRAGGEMFLIRESERGAPSFGTAVLTFPGETQPIAFQVRSTEEGGLWQVSFDQPDRFVDYEGRVNTWRGGSFQVNFTRDRTGQWKGQFRFEENDLGMVYLTRT
jgi:hypothetical protein